MNFCKKCGSEFIPSKGLINYCSLSCRNSKIWNDLDKQKKSIANTGKKLTAEHKKQISDSWSDHRRSEQAETARDRFKGKIVSNATRKKIRDANVGKKLSFETKNKLSTSTKKRYQENPNSHPNILCANSSESYPEKTLREYLEQHNLIENVHYIRQYKIDKYYVDFYFPFLNLIVEVDGEQWHKDVESRNIRDNILTQYYYIIHLWARPLIKKEYQNILQEIIRSVGVSD